MMSLSSAVPRERKKLVLAVLVTRQQLSVRQHEAAWDTRGGAGSLRDHLYGSEGGKGGEREKERDRVMLQLPVQQAFQKCME